MTVYTSSIDGYYEAVIDGRGISLRYLLPAIRTKVAMSDV
jgi:hypothetical protein